MSPRVAALCLLPLTAFLGACSSGPESHSLPKPSMPANGHLTDGHGTVALVNSDAKGPSDIGISCKGKGEIVLMSDTSTKPIAKVACDGGRVTSVQRPTTVKRLFVNTTDAVSWRIAMGDHKG